MKVKDFVSRDRELEARHEKTTEELAAHRWHWTLDESNPDRVSIKEYARRISRAFSPVKVMVNGYAAWQASPSEGLAVGSPITLNEFIQRERLGSERAEAAEAIAAASGKTFGAVSHPNMRNEVGEVLSVARDRAERKGTTVSEELPAVAEWRERGRRVRAKEREERQKSPFFFIEVEGHLGYAIRRLRDCLALVRDADFTGEEVEMIEGAVETLKTLISLIDLRVTGTNDVDWDAEFAAVMKETQ